MTDLVERLREVRQAFPLNRTWAMSLDAADLDAIIAALDAQPVGRCRCGHAPHADFCPQWVPKTVIGCDCEERAALASEPQP